MKIRTSTYRPSCAAGSDGRGEDLRCPYCGHNDLKVVDSRDSEVGEAIRRRRECLQCGQRFTTYERIEAVPFFVIKKDGRREDFDPHKLFAGLKKATEKREISPERLNAIVEEIEVELRRSGRVEIPSVEIGEMVMEKLKDLDEVAYIRFASVYREFMDLQQVKSEIEQVLSARSRRK
ncbi:MAG TPA: transcriptional regulator NrdR [Candidatus Acidoferrales bacterium]|nr:transcriptional regulator NrdR [Candidatus Acidoferrales bacterium]